MQRLSNAPDAELVKASLAGDQEAFGVIVRRYQGVVSAIVYNRCRGNVSRSEELAQETFLAAWKGLSSLVQGERLGPWLGGIARNVANSSSRKEQESLNNVSLDTCRLPEAASTMRDPSAQAISREQEQLLWQCLDRIPDKYREPMIMYYRQHKSSPDVAKTLGVSESTVRKRLERARAMLRQEMAATVEDLLSSSAPDANFSLVVVAALPTTSVTSAAKTMGVGALLGTIGTKLLGMSFWLGPIVGVFGGLFGVIQSHRGARSASERRFIVHGAIKLFSIVTLFTGLQFGLAEFRGLLSGNHYVALVALLWIVMAIMLAAFTYKSSRRHEQLQRKEFGEVQVSSSPPRQIIVGMGIGLMAGNSWMLVLAACAADWASFFVLSATIAALFWWSVCTILSRGPQAERQVMLTSFVAVVILLAVVVNFRLRTWFVNGGGTAFGFPSGNDVPEFPLFETNLLVFAVGLLMILPVALSKKVVHAESSDPLEVTE